MYSTPNHLRILLIKQLITQCHRWHGIERRQLWPLRLLGTCLETDCIGYQCEKANLYNMDDDQAVHDDVSKRKHFPHKWPIVRGIHRSPMNSLHKGQWRGALMFSLICVWINDCVNNREAGDLRCYRAHYDVIVMSMEVDMPAHPNYPGEEHFNTLSPRQSNHHFAHDIFKYIFLNEDVWIVIKILLNFVHKGPLINILSLVQVMAWRQTGENHKWNNHTRHCDIFWRRGREQKKIGLLSIILFEFCVSE